VDKVEGKSTTITHILFALFLIQALSQHKSNTSRIVYESATGNKNVKYEEYTNEMSNWAKTKSTILLHHKHTPVNRSYDWTNIFDAPPSTFKGRNPLMFTQTLFFVHDKSHLILDCSCHSKYIHKTKITCIRQTKIVKATFVHNVLTKPIFLIQTLKIFCFP